MSNYGRHVSFIWSIAETLRGNYKQSEYGRVVLPFTVLRRLDCVLEPTKDAVLAKRDTIPPNTDNTMSELMLNMASSQNFHNISCYSFANLLNDPDNIAANLNNMVNGFSADTREIFIERFELPKQITRLDKNNLLYLIVKQFAATDLHPDTVSNLEMGYIFEELIRRFSEQSNETAGEHFTPREVIRLMVNLLFQEDGDALTQQGIIRKLYDPTCGTGGMLSVAEEYLRELNPDAHLEVYGQELNDESYAICKSDMMIKGQNAKNIYPGNSFSEDGLPDQQFDYLLSNPPFGVEWKMVQDAIKDEHNTLGYKGRFGPGLPRVSDGSLLFVMHMIAKFNRPDRFSKPVRSRLTVVLNGSPLFTGSAGSGESNIRRWIIENDWLEAIIALPTDMFYNTGIATYIWIITNQKTAQRKGKIQLINATGFDTPMRKSLGSKRKQIAKADIGTITQLFGDYAEGGLCKIFDNTDFGYQRITVERPLKLNFQVSAERIERLKAAKGFGRLKADMQEAILTTLMDPRLRGDDNHETVIPVNAGIHQPNTPTPRTDDGGIRIYTNRDTFLADLKAAAQDVGLTLKAVQLKLIWQALSEKDDSAEPCRDKKGNLEPDSDLRDYENVPLKENIDDYFQREVLPHVPDAWIEHSKTKVGYEIPFNRHFYEYVPPRSLAEIDADLDKVSAEIMQLLREVHV
ncbi:MAG: SAM-dependent DNA methyltransferase [Chloroflexi bacterium]|nr:SAM-dependent DNA methyltransferase [Chloroflexota bacterium]